jgi:hypothetical protein
MTEEERELLIAAAAGAWRASDADGAPRAHPAWHDLDDAGRGELFAITAELRAIEAALDSDGLSSTVRAVLARIR